MLGKDAVVFLLHFYEVKTFGPTYLGNMHREPTQGNNLCCEKQKKNHKRNSEEKEIHRMGRTEQVSSGNSFLNVILQEFLGV